MYYTKQIIQLEYDAIKSLSNWRPRNEKTLNPAHYPLLVSDFIQLQQIADELRVGRRQGRHNPDPQT